MAICHSNAICGKFVVVSELVMSVVGNLSGVEYIRCHVCVRLCVYVRK